MFDRDDKTAPPAHSPETPQHNNPDFINDVDGLSRSRRPVGAQLATNLPPLEQAYQDDIRTPGTDENHPTVFSGRRIDPVSAIINAKAQALSAAGEAKAKDKAPNGRG